jgi:alpha-N-acetylglucosaminidase
MLHNYGGSRALYGNLTLLANEPILVSQIASSYFIGTGLTMEAIDQNPIVYEFMNEMSYHRTSPDVESWVSSYADRRYGLHTTYVSAASKDSILQAWQALYHNNYHGETPTCHFPCERRSVITLVPTWDMYQIKSMEATPLVDIWTQMLASKLSSTQRAYAYDLADVTRQVMSNLFYDYFYLVKAAYSTQDEKVFLPLVQEMLILINDLDMMLSSHEGYLLGKWISEARSLASAKEEADLFEYNARNQITLWGNEGEISDYAAKNWGGLMKDFYLKRWNYFFSLSLETMKKNESIDMDTYYYDQVVIGQEFCEDYSTVFPDSPSGDSVSISQLLHSKYGNGYSSHHSYSIQENITIDGFNILSDPTWTTNIKQLERLCDASLNCVGFTSDGMLKSGGTVKMIAMSGVTTYLKTKTV